MAEDMKLELAEVKSDLLKSIHETREYAVEQAEKKRNQAIGTLGFAALVLTLAGWLLIDQTVQRKLDDIGQAKLLDRAEAASKQAETEAATAAFSAKEIDQLKTSYAAELEEIQDAVAEVDSLRLSLDTADTRTEYEWEGGGVVGGANSIWKLVQCPAGQVLVGVNLRLGGTCSHYCDPDGRPVSQVKAICRPLRMQSDLDSGS